jgi:hypothetical protein
MEIDIKVISKASLRFISVKKLFLILVANIAIKNKKQPFLPDLFYQYGQVPAEVPSVMPCIAGVPNTLSEARLMIVIVPSVPPRLVLLISQAMVIIPLLTAWAFTHLYHALTELSCSV